MNKVRLSNKQQDIKDKMKIDPSRTASAIVKFMRKQFRIRKKSKAIIGLSGGIDSAVVLALTVKAIGADNITAVEMPYKKVTPLKNMGDVDLLTENFGIPKNSAREMDITKEVDSIAGKHCEMTAKRLGNIMARVRMTHLYDFSSEFEVLVAGTGNKSEILLGYFTMHGDGACDMEPIGGLYKTHIYQLACYLGIPKTIIDKSPSANLWPGQTDEREIGYLYDFIDVLLYLMYNKKIPPDKLVEQYQYKEKDIKAITSWTKKMNIKTNRYRFVNRFVKLNSEF